MKWEKACGTQSELMRDMRLGSAPLSLPAASASAASAACCSSTGSMEATVAPKFVFHLLPGGRQGVREISLVRRCSVTVLPSAALLTETALRSSALRRVIATLAHEDPLAGRRSSPSCPSSGSSMSCRRLLEAPRARARSPRR